MGINQKEWEAKEQNREETLFVRDVEEQCGPEKRKRGTVTKETFGQKNQMR